jgi:hypothetical protein
MPKKILFVTVFLLLVSVQALTVSCDIRCSMMRTSTDSHASHGDEQTADCHSMSMERSHGTSLIAGDFCATTTCGTELKAINKSSDQDNAGSSRLLASAVALLVDSLGNNAPSRTTAFASLGRGGDRKPLAQRPGSSLRI